jgi:hypothetical protein
MTGTGIHAMIETGTPPTSSATIMMIGTTGMTAIATR